MRVERARTEARLIFIWTSAYLAHCTMKSCKFWAFEVLASFALRQRRRGEIETVISVHIAHCCVDAALSVASRSEPTGQGALPKSEPLVHLPDTPQPG